MKHQFIKPTLPAKLYTISSYSLFICFIILILKPETMIAIVLWIMAIVAAIFKHTYDVIRAVTALKADDNFEPLALAVIQVPCSIAAIVAFYLQIFI